MTVVPIHVRSRNSLGFGTAAVEDLAERAAALGVPAIALTDIETLSGQLRFHQECKDRGLKPISGVELREGHARHDVGRREGRLVLLAKDAKGYANLCRIVSRRRIGKADAAAGAPIGALGADTEGLFVLTDDPDLLEGLLGRDAGGSANVERQQVRLLLVRSGGNGGGDGADEVDAESERRICEASRKHGVPVVADLDVVGLEPEDLSLHALLLAIRHNLPLEEVRRMGFDSDGLDKEGQGKDGFSRDRLGKGGLGKGVGLLNERAFELFEDMPEAVAEAQRIADACTLDLTTARAVPPRLPGLAADEVGPELRSRCHAALDEHRSRGGYRGSEYDDRLGRELHTIERLGFTDYFLAVSEIIAGARKLAIPTSGRGSAAGSLVAHLIGVSQVDPVETDLLFERFLHEQREAAPDIDIDVASTGRDDLNEFVTKRFGRDRVAGIAAYGTYRSRSAVRAGLTALRVAPAKISAIAKRLDPGARGGEGEAEFVEQALRFSPIRAVRDAAPLIARLVGMPSHISLHPGGVIIGDGPIDRLAPLERVSSGAVVTQYDLRSVEHAGFLKIDLLGNHFLSEYKEVMETLPAGTRIPDDDERTWRTLDEADTVGCFQIESPAVRSVLRRLPMSRFSDLVATLAVVRPGVAGGASKDRYLRRARGEEEFTPLEFLGLEGNDERFSGLRGRLERSKGVLLFDEDIIRLLATVAGTDLATADRLRTAIIAAGDDPAAMSELGKEFVERAVASGLEREVGVRAWQAVERFAAYSFPEAHAASYALLAWRAAWLRTHAPLEFGCALINHHGGLYPHRTTVAAVQRWGVTILPPSVNESQIESTVDRSVPAVRVGFRAIKGLTKRTTGDLLKGRPFGELGEVLERGRPGKRELRALLLSGACDDLPPLSPQGYPLVHEAVLQGMEGEAGPDVLDAALKRVDALPDEGPELDEFRRYQALSRVRNEVAIMEMHISDHPMRLLRAEASRLGCLRSRNLAPHMGRTVKFAGLLAATRRVFTRQGPLRFLTLEDEDGLAECVLPPEAYARLSPRLTTPGPYLVKGTMRETNGDVHLAVSELLPFHARE